ncbi:MAG: DUF1109 family protein [Deltaproteobacteria bacterium]|nr:DUF1109 family protein [Deltaproteobacteria bacterium]MBW2413207.1 DUF1109 family protein [Deltaproteobacteria bacterium]
MSRSTDSLIRELSRGLQPVRRVPPLHRVAALAAALALATAAIALVTWGLNETFRGLNPEPRYWVAIAGLLSFAAGGAAAALGSTVPGNDPLIRGGVAAMVAGAMLTLLGSALFLARISAGEPAGSFWSALSLVCLGRSSLVAIPAAALLTLFAARGFPHRPWLTVGFGTLGLVAFGALPVTMSCGSESIFHIVFAHVLAPATAGLGLWAVLWLLYALLRSRREQS